MKRLIPLAFGVFVALSGAASASDAVDWVRDRLQSSADGSCGIKRAAALSTLQRIEGLELPETGKALVVNIAAGVITAYEDGIPVIESRAVVGNPETPTPEMTTFATFVRANPTWTVPESILRRKDWRSKLDRDPEYFDAAGFDVVLDGYKISPYEAAGLSDRISRFVQRPGSQNALGLVKIGLHNSNGIYLHDTNRPDAFLERIRSMSSGCVRVERVREIAAWVLGVSVARMNDLIDGDDRTDRTPSSRVPVIIGYWTAWPDGNGHVRVYPDIYGKDEAVSECGYAVGSAAENHRDINWEEREAR
jgi:murein L,D-transpeptidase YcbB/YkuD